MNRKLTRNLSFSLLSLSMVLCLTACSSSGNVTCDQFMAMSEADQLEVATEMVKAHGDKASEMQILWTRGKVVMYCEKNPGGTRIDAAYDW